MDEVRMDYELVEETAAAFEQSAEQLRGVEEAIRRVAQLIDEGAYVNRQGAQWSDALRSRVTDSLRQAQDRLQETAQDLLGAMRDLQNGDHTGARLFNS